jgi:hypothetical protein
MTVGSPTTNSLDAAKKHVGLRFVCLTDKNTRFPELPDFPTKACKGGIMTVSPIHYLKDPMYSLITRRYITSHRAGMERM